MTQTTQPMSVDELKHMAAVIRCDIIEMITTAQIGDVMIFALLF